MRDRLVAAAGVGGEHFRGAAAVVGVEDVADVAEEGEVVLYGVSDLVVVRTPERTLVLPRERAADLKTLLSELEKKK